MHMYIQWWKEFVLILLHQWSKAPCKDHFVCLSICLSICNTLLLLEPHAFCRTLFWQNVRRFQTMKKNSCFYRKVQIITKKRASVEIGLQSLVDPWPQLSATENIWDILVLGRPRFQWQWISLGKLCSEIQGKNLCTILICYSWGNWGCDLVLAFAVQGVKGLSFLLAFSEILLLLGPHAFCKILWPQSHNMN